MSATHNCRAAGIFAYGAAAAKERDHKYDTADDNDANGYGPSIERVTEGTQGAQAGQYDGADHDQQNAASL